MICTKPCTVMNSNLMTCMMPPVDLPTDFEDYLKGSDGTVSGNSDTNALASYILPNSSDRADIYAGFALDGFMQYTNISASLPNIKLTFYRPPTLVCNNNEIVYDPNDNNLVKINGSKLTDGIRLVDVNIIVGDGRCSVATLTDNQISYRPPNVKPNPSGGAACNEGRLSVQVTIGYAKYQCGCMTYSSWNPNYPLIIGLVVGLGGALIVVLVIIVAVIVVKRCRPELSFLRTAKKTDKQANYQVTIDHLPSFRQSQNVDYHDNLPSDDGLEDDFRQLDETTTA